MEEYLGKDRELYVAFIFLEKACDRVDREALWNILKIYGVGGQLMEGIKACVKVNEELNDRFAVGLGVRQECVMSPWLFNIFMDKCMREMKVNWKK